MLAQDLVKLQGLTGGATVVAGSDTAFEMVVSCGRRCQARSIECNYGYTTEES
jgi:hypothetical protein